MPTTPGLTAMRRELGQMITEIVEKAYLRMSDPVCRRDTSRIAVFGGDLTFLYVVYQAVQRVQTAPDTSAALARLRDLIDDCDVTFDIATYRSIDVKKGKLIGELPCVSGDTLDKVRAFFDLPPIE